MAPTGLEDSIRRRMQERGLGEDVINSFIDMVRRAREQASAYTSPDDVSAPSTDLILETAWHADERRELEEHGRGLLSQAVVIKLNGGRSTTMGGEVPKGILPAKDGLSYLEIIAGQMKALSEELKTNIPLVLMNSFFTDGPTQDYIKEFDTPVLTFLQSQVPRLTEPDWEPLCTGTEEDWVPPGHGDVYMSLLRSGLLDRLLNEGKRYAFISNLDNLCAVPEPWILGLIERDRIEFMLEVTNRTDEDKKGGTLVVSEGNLFLLEIAQVAPEDRDSFMDIERFKVFNTNNVWVDLEALKPRLLANELKLPIIQNRKDINGHSVIQLETAMGSAVGAFERARGLRVGRDRFFPTKSVEDLFVLQSDACILDDKMRLQPSPSRPDHLPLRPKVIFGEDFLESPLELPNRFDDPKSVSLAKSARFEVHGPAYFERNVTIEGDVRVIVQGENRHRFSEGTVLTDGTFP